MVKNLRPKRKTSKQLAQEAVQVERWLSESRRGQAESAGTQRSVNEVVGELEEEIATCLEWLERMTPEERVKLIMENVPDVLMFEDNL